MEKTTNDTPNKNKLLGFFILAITLTIGFLEWAYIMDFFYFLLEVTPWKPLNWVIIVIVFILLFPINIVLGKLVYLGRSHISKNGEKVYQKALKKNSSITLYLRSFESERRKGIENEWEDAQPLIMAWEHLLVLEYQMNKCKLLGQIEFMLNQMKIGKKKLSN